MLDSFIRGHDEIAASLYAKLTDNRDVSAPQDADDFAFCPAVTRNSPDVNQGAVPMHRFRCFIGRKKDVRLDASIDFVRN